MHKVLVTGANGFVGQAVCRSLATAGHAVLALTRAPCAAPGIRNWVFEPLDFAALAESVPNDLALDSVIHLAARVHVMDDPASDSLAAYRRTNVAGSLEVARAARRAGARRLVFVSSVKALGETEPGRPWREDDVPMPVDPYGISKLEAEQALSAFGREHGMEVVIVRPPLVYGPGVRANFLSLMRAVARGVPLPLGAVQARRSMVCVENLADALSVCAVHPAAANRIFHITDGEDLALPEVVRTLAQAMDVRARLPRIPLAWLRVAGRLTGRSAAVARLTGSLRLDCRAARAVLAWTPPVTVQAGLQRTAQWYVATQGRR